jgi:hypothetical protein
MHISVQKRAKSAKKASSKMSTVLTLLARERARAATFWRWRAKSAHRQRLFPQRRQALATKSFGKSESVIG